MACFRKRGYPEEPGLRLARSSRKRTAGKVHGSDQVLGLQRLLLLQLVLQSDGLDFEEDVRVRMQKERKRVHLDWLHDKA